MKDANCIFCKIANGEIPSGAVYEDDDFKVILDLGPASRGHSLILPKEHYRDLTELPDELAAKVLPVARRVGKLQMEKLGAAGFNVVQNNGEEAGQTVMHYHVHVIPRYAGGENMVSWNPGNLTPDEASEILKSLEK